MYYDFIFLKMMTNDTQKLFNLLACNIDIIYDNNNVCDCNYVFKKIIL